MITFSKNIVNGAPTSDDENSLKSSRQSCRRLQRSNNRDTSRSLSRESSSSLFQKFYVKNIYQQAKEVSKSRASLLEDQIVKKREPTPCKSRKFITSTSQQAKKDIREKQAIIMEKGVVIIQLEEQLRQKNYQIDKLNKRLQIKEECIQKMSKELREREDKIAKLSYNNKESNKRIEQLQQSVLHSQQNLITTNNALEKLKKSIQENRLNDIKKQNESLKAKLTKYSCQRQLLADQLKRKVLETVELEKQNKILRGKVLLETNLKNQSMKQAYLQTEINRLKGLITGSSSPLEKQMLEYFDRSEQEKIRLKDQLKKLAIKLDYINRKHLEQVKLLSKTKTDEIMRYKKKCRDLQSQFLRKEEEWQERVRFHRQNSSKSLLRPPPSPYCRTEQNGSGDLGKVRMLSVSFQLSSDND